MQTNFNITVRGANETDVREAARRAWAAYQDDPEADLPPHAVLNVSAETVARSMDGTEETITYEGDLHITKMVS